MNMSAESESGAVAGRKIYGDYPVFEVGMSITFVETLGEQWTVQAISRSGRFVACTKPFPEQDTVQYTVMDLEAGIRGTDNYGSLGYETAEECVEALACFEATLAYQELEDAGLVPEVTDNVDVSWAPAEYHEVLAEADGTARLRAEISRRNNVRIAITSTADPVQVGG